MDHQSPPFGKTGAGDDVRYLVVPRDGVCGVLPAHRGVSCPAPGGVDGDGGERRLCAAAFRVLRTLSHGVSLRGDFLHGGDDEGDAGVRGGVLLYLHFCDGG